MKNFPALISVLLISTIAFSQRVVTNFGQDWQFLSASNRDAAKETDWKSITIPHTWNLDAYQKRDYKRGQCWYRKKFAVPLSFRDKEIYLRFDAVNSYAEVYLNGQLLTSHSGGYSAFQVHLPKGKLKPVNELSVLVDNRNIDIPPLSGDFTIFGGIYRRVWVIAVEKEHFDLDNHGSAGVFISTPMVTRKSARVNVKGVVTNPERETLKVQLQISNNGKAVLSKSIKVSSGSEWQINNLLVTNPQLWSPGTPHLYHANLKLIRRNKVIDELNIPVGFRWFSADTRNGFMLNGEPLKLMGTNRHQDEKPFGIAVPQWVHEKDIRMIKDMGANFLRLAHYQQDDEVLRLCDSLGLIVWEEIPVVDIIGDNETFRKNARSELVEMIRQHYNHPSVVFWGYMNEAVIQVQYRVPKEQQPAFYQKTVALAKELEHLLKQEDNSRLSVMACHGSDIYNEIGLAGITDVLGWNLYQGWYSDNLSDFEKYTDDQHKRYPDRPIIISEFGAGSDKRLHTLHPEKFDFSIAYQQKLLEHYLPEIVKRPYIIGAAEWNFIDFNVASRQESMPRTNNKGLVFNDRTPKDVYYYFQSFLRKDTALVHIASDDWKVRDVISDGDSTTVPLKIYSNQSLVQLKVNGRMIAQNPVQNFHSDWLVKVPKGNMIVEAIASQNGSITATDTIQVVTRFTPFSTAHTNQEKWDLAINVGSNCSYYDQENDLTWHADKSYTPGSWGYLAGSIFRKSPGRIGTTAEIAGTDNNPLFQTMREDMGMYRIDAPPGKYEIELCFADLYNAPPAQAYDLSKGVQNYDGLNVFDISINDSVYYSNFSPFLAADKKNNVAVVRKVILNNTGDAIRITLLNKQGHRFLNGLRVKQL